MAISTICRWETGMVHMMALGFTRDVQAHRRSPWCAWYMFFSLTMMPAHLGIAAQPEVVHDVAGEGLVQLLVHHGHAIFQGFLGVFEVDFLAFQVNSAASSLL